MMEVVMKLLGENRISLGTDYPFPLGELEPGKLIESMPFSNEVKEKMLGLNALEWLGLERSKFIS